MRATRDLADEHAHQVRVAAPGAQQDLRDAGEAVTSRLVRLLDRADGVEHVAPRLAKDRLEQLFLRTEIVIEESVRDARLLGDVSDAARVVALAREHAHRCVEDEAPLVLLTC